MESSAITAWGEMSLRPRLLASNTYPAAAAGSDRGSAFSNLRRRINQHLPAELDDRAVRAANMLAGGALHPKTGDDV